MTRHFYIDRLRVLLTGLVIFHHTAITYGASGGWFYRERATDASASSQLLTLFCAVNQSFFMGAFFLLAGLYVPTALERKGAKTFLKERLVRLGLPVLAFGLLLGPLTVMLARLRDGSRSAPIFEKLPLFELGPLWFPWSLLLFSMGYVLLRAFFPKAQLRLQTPMPSNAAWMRAAIGVGLAALLLRQWVPVGHSVLGLQLGYFASYVFLFSLGCAAASRDWIERLSWPQARLWLIVSLLAIPLLPMAISLAARISSAPQNFSGGLNISSITYAFWEPLVAWGIIAALLVVFRQRFNFAHARWDRWGRQAYGAFVVHAPITVALSTALSGWAAPALVKFALIGSLAVITSFFVSGVMLRAKWVQRAL
ncbi:MAG: acyltransferase [Burkholderiales bacterium]|nr:MAG: acyltransferase [Burkholderiales bacterium]